MTIPEARGSAFKTVDKCQQVAKVIIQSQNSKFDFLALLEGIKVKGDHDEKKVERHLRFFRVIALLVDDELLFKINDFFRIHFKCEEFMHSTIFQM